MSDKMITFEEWWNSPDTDQEVVEGFLRSDAESLWKSARQGMIPAENAVEIPPVSEWPKDAAYISVQFRTNQDDFAGVVCEDIPPPKPVWVPKVGEAVFANDTEDSGQILVVKIHDIDDDGRCEMFGHFGTWWHPSHLKPFHESHIGKPWSEIPGGIE